jgi:transmembrane sensor
MTDRIDENPPMSIPEQAAEWLLRWHCGDLSIAERFEYLQWLKTSPVHIAETLRMCRLYSWLENTKLKLFLTNEDSFSNVVELPPRERERPAARGARRAGLWRVRVAASMATIGLGVLFALGAKVVWLDHRLQTQASEWRNMPLSDGSSITAAPYTRLRHEIDDDRRVITLTEGSAMFRVAKDDSRPFLVNAGIAVVTAMGTEFTVERRGETVIVTMREGEVVVSPPADAVMAFTNVPLATDDQLTMSPAWAQPLVARVNAEQTTEWVNARLTFKDGDTVGSAVARFNVYNRIKIAVDGRTSSRPWRGAFDANDPLSFAAAVQQSTGAALVREASELVRIGRRKEQTL